MKTKYFTLSSSLLYPQSFRVKTLKSTLRSLVGTYEQTTLDKREHRPVYKLSQNENHIFYDGGVS